MFLRLKNHRGQNTAEYAIVIALIIGAVIAMQIYVKRGLQAKMKDATDSITDKTTELGTTKQYEPYYSEQSMTSAQKSTSEVEAQEGASKTTKTDQTSTRQGYQTYKDTTGQD